MYESGVNEVEKLVRYYTLFPKLYHDEIRFPVAMSRLAFFSRRPILCTVPLSYLD